jgi:hypothetical protein
VLSQFHEALSLLEARSDPEYQALVYGRKLDPESQATRRKIQSLSSVHNRFCWRESHH